MLIGGGRIGAAALSLTLALGGCGYFDDEERLEGERIPVRSVERQAAISAPAATVAAAPLPQPQPQPEWTHTSGNPSHYGGHIAGSATLNRAWVANAGSGDGRITGSPIVVGGRVYALDGDARLSSFSASSGAPGWSVSLAPSGENGNEGFGGGLAAVGDTIYATTGFGEVLAVRASAGDILWRQRFGAPFRAAPAAVDGTVIAVSRDNQAFGLNAETGQPIWRLQGATGEAGLLGGASPAVAGELAVLPFTSGEIVAAGRRSGRRLWTAVLSGGRRGLARSAISDVTGDPVILGPLVVAANQSGRIVAIETQTGRRVWTRSIGSTGPIWAAGETLFVMGDDAVLRRLSARDGGTVWEARLPEFDDPADREGSIAYSGPVLVGGRVIVADDQGVLHAFDAESGREVATADIGDGSVVQPVAAGGLLYVLAEDGTLYAFR